MSLLLSHERFIKEAGEFGLSQIGIRFYSESLMNMSQMTSDNETSDGPSHI